MLGFAIVGCGMIARFHARALAEVPGARLVASAAVDVEPRSARFGTWEADAVLAS